MPSIAEVVRDAAQDAVNGLRVVILTGSLKSAADLHRAFEATNIGDIPRTFTRSAGRRRVDFPSHGGSILFTSIRSVRGLSADHVYLSARSVSPEVMERVAPIVCASKDPAIIGYFLPGPEGTVSAEERAPDGRVRTGQFTSHPAGWVDGRTKAGRAAKAAALAVAGG